MGRLVALEERVKVLVRETPTGVISRLRALEVSVASMADSMDRLVTALEAGQAQRALAEQVRGIAEVVGQIRAIVEGAR